MILSVLFVVVIVVGADWLASATAPPERFGFGRCHTAIIRRLTAVLCVRVLELMPYQFKPNILTVTSDQLK